MKSIRLSVVRVGRLLSQRGLSLVELMVALAIGLLLLLGLVEIFGASRAAFSAAEGSARNQENGRFALEFLRRDARMVGHMGCLNELGYLAMPELMFNHNATGDARSLATAGWAMRIDMPLEAYEFTGTGPAATYALTTLGTATSNAEWSPALPASLNSVATSAVRGSDVLVLRYLNPESVGLDGWGVNINGASGNATVDAIVDEPSWTALSPFVEQGQMYAVANCRTLSLFQASSGANLGGLFSANMAGLNTARWTALEVYGGAGSRLYRFNIAVYYVGLDASGEPALFVHRFDPNGVSQLSGRNALVEGVENLQLVFGVDASVPGGPPGSRDDYADTYGSASDISAAAMNSNAWRSVISMRIGLLMRSPSSSSPITGAAPPPLRVADTVITPPNDSRLRGEYETMIAIRNRVRR